MPYDTNPASFIPVELECRFSSVPTNLADEEYTVQVHNHLMAPALPNFGDSLLNDSIIEEMPFIVDEGLGPLQREPGGNFENKIVSDYLPYS